MFQVIASAAAAALVVGVSTMAYFAGRRATLREAFLEGRHIDKLVELLLRETALNKAEKINTPTEKPSS